MKKSRTWIEINATALNHNIATIRSLIADCQQLGIVVKSNGYGHGLAQIGTFLDTHTQIDWLFTAGLQEALELRKAGIKKPILVMSYLDEDPLLAIKHDIQLCLTNMEQLSWLQKLPVPTGKKFLVHLKIDTGLSRLGVTKDLAANFLHAAATTENILITGIFTHLADNKNKNPHYTKRQLEEFTHTLSSFRKMYTKPILAHARASATLLSGIGEDTFDMTRIGAACYGLYKSAEQEHAFLNHQIKLLPVLTWKAAIIETKIIGPDTAVSYGFSYITTKSTKVAVIPVGYFDGYPSGLSNKGMVSIHGVLAPILGVITMNMMMVDITHIQNVTVGDTLELIADKPGIRPSELAALAGIGNLELLSRLNTDIERIIIERALEKKPHRKEKSSQVNLEG